MSTGSTVFEVLLASIHHATGYNRDDVVPPAAILWPDEKREWEWLLPRIRRTLPHLLTIGSFDPTNRKGSAIWLPCVLAGKLPKCPPRDPVT